MNKAGSGAVEVTYKVGDMVIDPNDPNSVTSRPMRRMLLAEGRKQSAKYAHLVHPETGERPRILLFIPKVGSMSMQVRLVTDSPAVREWLKGKGIVIEDASEAIGTSRDADSAGNVTEAA